MKTELLIKDETYSGKTRELYLTTGLPTEVNVNIIYEMPKAYDNDPFKNYGVFYVGSKVADLGNGDWIDEKGNSVYWKFYDLDEGVLPQLLNYNWDYTLWQLDEGWIEPTKLFSEFLQYRDDRKAKLEQARKEATEREQKRYEEHNKRHDEVLAEFESIKYTRHRNQTFVITDKDGKSQYENGYIIKLNGKPEMGIHSYEVGKRKKFVVTHLNTGYALGDPLNKLIKATEKAVWFAPVLSGLTAQEVSEKTDLKQRLSDYLEYLA